MSKYILVAVVTAATVLAGAALVRGEPTAMSPKWEYAVREVRTPDSASRIEATIQEFAAQGWTYDTSLNVPSSISAGSTYVIMKRAK